MNILFLILAFVEWIILQVILGSSLESLIKSPLNIVLTIVIISLLFGYKSFISRVKDTLAFKIFTIIQILVIVILAVLIVLSLNNL